MSRTKLDVRDVLRAMRESGAKSSAKEVARLLLAPGSDPGRRAVRLLGALENVRKGSKPGQKLAKKPDRPLFSLVLRPRPLAKRAEKATKACGKSRCTGSSPRSLHKSTGISHRCTGSAPKRGGDGDAENTAEGVSPDADVPMNPVDFLKSIYALGRAIYEDAAEETPSGAEDVSSDAEDDAMDPADLLESICALARAGADAAPRTTFTQTDPEMRTAGTQTLKKKPPAADQQEKPKEEEIPEEIRLAMYV